MTTSAELPHHVLELRLSLLDQLASALTAAQAALLKSDLGSFEAQTSQQLHLCHALQTQRLKTPRAAPDTGPAAAEIFQQRHRELQEQVQAMEERVRRLNRTHACLLQRAQRSLAVLRHIVASQSPTYLPEVGIRESEV